MDGLIDEISKTQHTLADIQSTLTTLESIMNQEYSNFHDALNEEKIKVELLESRLTNREKLEEAKLEKLNETLKHSEAQLNYRMNDFLQDAKDEMEKLQISIQSSLAKMKEIHRLDVENRDEYYYKKLPPIPIVQVIANFLVSVLSFVTNPIQNAPNIVVAVFMAFITYNVCGFVLCNVLCSPYHHLNFFSFVDKFRSFLTKT